MNGFTVVVVEGEKGLGHLGSVEPGKHFGGGFVIGGRYGGPVVVDTFVVVICGQRLSSEPG